MPGATSRIYTIASVTRADDGSFYRVRVSDTHGSVTSLPAMLTVLNTPPVVNITLPTAGSKYSAGQTIVCAGTGQDAEDGTLPSSAFTWWVDVARSDTLWTHGQRSGRPRTRHRRSAGSV
jgi:hypothetical protein